MMTLHGVRCCLDEPLPPTESPTRHSPTNSPTVFPTPAPPTHAPVCQNDECFVHGTQNECVDNDDGSYHCKCGTGWINYNLEGAPGCVVDYCVRGDPCKVFEGEGLNNCKHVDAVNVSCVCGQGWMNANDGSQCVKWEDPCTNNPCGSDLRSENVCISTNGFLNYTCECHAKGWRVSQAGTSCVEIPNPCEGPDDPCAVFKNAENECHNHLDGSYHCSCGRGWSNYSLPQDTLQMCVSPPNQCTEKDPCFISQEPANICLSQLDGSYRCECNGKGWKSDEDFTSCIPPSNPCEDEKMCSGNQHPDNGCVYLGGGEFRCVCAGFGWEPAVDGLACISRANPCENNDIDPCQTAVEPENECVNRYDGTYVCNCWGKWKRGPGAQSCEALTHPCDTSDPCSSLLHAANKCVPKGESYTCYCNGNGWQVDNDAKACVPPTDMCKTGELKCGSDVNPFNVCNDHGDGTFSCSCRAPGWSIALRGQNCVCPDPCEQSDPCNSFFDPGNKCSFERRADDPSKCSEPKCSCAHGWLTVVDLNGVETCALANPCDRVDYDPCLQKANVANICVANLNPETGHPLLDNPYTCVCRGQGFLSSVDGLRCEQVDPCSVASGDPCALELANLNSCHIKQTHGRMSHTCSCDHPGWVATPDNDGCVPCSNPCSIMDPCQMDQSSSNSCSWEYDTAPWATLDASLKTQMPAEVTRAWFEPETKTHSSGGLSVETILVQGGKMVSRDDTYDPTSLDLVASIPNLAPVPTTKFLEKFSTPSASVPSAFVPLDTSGWRPPVCGTFQCECGPKWISMGAGCELEACVDPCSVDQDPCMRKHNSVNKCVLTDKLDGLEISETPAGTRFCSSHKCECQAPGWFPSSDGTSCEECQDRPCDQGDPCNTEQNPLNECIPSTEQCGDFTCICKANGYQLDILKKSCVPEKACPTPCNGDNGDPCKISGSSKNTCSYILPPNISTDCPRHRCSCDNEGGWTLNPEGNRCLLDECPDPCEKDPCSTGTNPANKCKYHKSLSAGRDRVKPDIRPRCGTFSCTCAPGWEVAFGGQACSKIGVNPFSQVVADKEATTPAAPFKPVSPVVVKPDGSLECVNPCDDLADPCAVKSEPENACKYHKKLTARRNIDRECGQYTCVCKGKGWIPRHGGQGCIRANSSSHMESHAPSIVACQSNECSVSEHPRNQCIAQPGGAYTCICDLRNGWVPGTGGLKCMRQESPYGQRGERFEKKPERGTARLDHCSGHDNCKTSEHGNTCYSSDTRDVYICECTAPGFRRSADGKSCDDVAPSPVRVQGLPDRSMVP